MLATVCGDCDASRWNHSQGHRRQLACIVLICMPSWGHATCNMTTIKRPPPHTHLFSLALSRSLQCTMQAANWTRAFWMATLTRRATSISAWASLSRQKPLAMTSAEMRPIKMCSMDNTVWPMRSRCCLTSRNACRPSSSCCSRTDPSEVNSMT